ncbi:hypothetical protein PYW08_011599 [Mythimna loreyi]|uniref:Uncharacterized protein n=1 Tax=Mythimna loreyi TaxID=667449 RepID=A0ACC2QQ13_9NEOP|nr:hypothetical protein PYW08_011599 [Mythimna loreyi]
MYVVTKSISSKAPSCSSLRNWLLFWASLRLAVSVLWTGFFIIATFEMMNYYWLRPEEIDIMYNNAETTHMFVFGVCAVAWQLVELGMIVLFIVAGVKKSASLYRVYFYYSILTLIMYIISMFLCFKLSYSDGHYFGEIYLTYHINELPFVHDDTAFVVAFIIDICFELLLIKLIKKMMDKYSPVKPIEDNATCEKV